MFTNADSLLRNVRHPTCSNYWDKLSDPLYVLNDMAVMVGYVSSEALLGGAEVAKDLGQWNLAQRLKQCYLEKYDFPERRRGKKHS